MSGDLKSMSDRELAETYFALSAEVRENFRRKAPCRAVTDRLQSLEMAIVTDIRRRGWDSPASFLSVFSRVACRS